MKRVFKREEEPYYLKRYREKYPLETWDRFHRYDRRAYNQIKKTILEDQHYLCAYCEIDIKFSDPEVDGERTIDDFRVEHFYPKSLTEDGKHNYHLDWWNMLGVCHGGSQALVVDAKTRYTRLKNDRTCDVPKSDKPISGEILNPLIIPRLKRIYRYRETSGMMLVDEETCPPSLAEKAKNTIRELNLNAPRLMRMRKAVIEKLDELVIDGQVAGKELEEVLAEMAEIYLPPSQDNRYMAFYSVIRWYLGEYAETVIKMDNLL